MSAEDYSKIASENVIKMSPAPSIDSYSKIPPTTDSSWGQPYSHPQPGQSYMTSGACPPGDYTQMQHAYQNSMSNSISSKYWA